MTSSSESPALSIVLPAYEEAENLTFLLPNLAMTLETLGVSSEILVVDTAEPRDETAAICSQFGVRHVRRRGGDTYGAAIRTGIADSRGEHVIIMDTDGSHDPEFIATLWAHRTDADVVIASRYVSGGGTDNPWILVVLSRWLNFVFSLLVKLPARDVSNSFRLYDGARVRSLHLTSEHFDIQEEILARLLWEQDPTATIAEVPFTFRARRFGTSKRSLIVFVFAFLGSISRLRGLRKRIQRGPLAS